MNKIQPPTGFGIIIVGIINIILFVIYNFVMQVFIGFIIGGFYEIKREELPSTDDPIFGIGALIALIIVIILTVIFREKIYFVLVKGDEQKSKEESK